MAKHIILFVFLLATYALASTTYALSLGSIAKNDVARIESSDAARFRLLFWSRDAVNQSVSLSSKAPDGWSVIIEPESFEISRFSGSEYIHLDGETIPATPVNVIAFPGDAAGKYNIVITALAGNTGQDISFFQERALNLTVYVGNSTFAGSSKADITGAAEQIGGSDYNDYNNIIILIAVVLSIIAASAVIYYAL